MGIENSAKSLENVDLAMQDWFLKVQVAKEMDHVFEITVNI